MSWKRGIYLLHSGTKIPQPATGQYSLQPALKSSTDGQAMIWTLAFWSRGWLVILFLYEDLWRENGCAEATEWMYGSMQSLHLSKWVLRTQNNMEYKCEILELCLDLFFNARGRPWGAVRVSVKCVLVWMLLYVETPSTAKLTVICLELLETRKSNSNRQGLLRFVLLLQHDNARPRTTRPPCQHFTFGVSSNHAYSLDLVPRYYHMLEPLKVALVRKSSARMKRLKRPAYKVSQKILFSSENSDQVVDLH